MKKILENARYVVILAVISALAGSVFLFVWTSVKMVYIAVDLTRDLMSPEATGKTAHIVPILDSFLLAVILYIFAIGLYELFIGRLKLPEWLVIHDLDDLKKKLSSVIALMLAVTFLEHLAEWKDPEATLMFAVAIAAVIFALIFYIKIKEKETRE
ncbi:MAG: YqhA family protein [Deltaproteobacteria bacterium]|nr:YqhA family protein [Deltaproteobacteria bacterium]